LKNFALFAPFSLPQPALGAMEEVLLVLQHLCFYTEGKYRNPNPYINHMNVHIWSDDALDPSPAYRFDPQAPNGYYLVNGM
jgi:hypothetical protein